MQRQILTLELAPGEDLNEMVLCERYGLSRTPLREVLRQLAGEGYVTLQPNRGARVSDLSYMTLRAFFLTAPMIYAEVLRLAARNAQPDQIAALKKAQDAFVRALENGSVRERTLANKRFHEITGEMSGNEFLLPSFRRLLIDHARIGMTFFNPREARMGDKLSAARQQHDAIIAAIEAGDDEGAARLAREHWALSRDQIGSFVMPDGLETTLDAPLRAEPA